MAVDVLLFVSKRARVVAAALLCLAAGRLAAAVATGSPVARATTEVRVPVAP